MRCQRTVLVVFVSFVVCLALVADEWKSGIVWKEPAIVSLNEANLPSDAVVLFDGTSLDAWENGDKWMIKNGVATATVAGITTKQSFGDCQLHIEWATPSEVKGEGQGRGNSGVYFQQKYEIQILDSFQNTTYFDGQAGAIYKTKPPLVNACRGPGQWQTYDIIFTAPKFDESGKLSKPAFITAFHNGVLIQNHTELKGATNWDRAPEYTAHSARLPIHIQHHGNPVMFRNIWLREIPELESKTN